MCPEREYTVSLLEIGPAAWLEDMEVLIVLILVEKLLGMPICIGDALLADGTIIGVRGGVITPVLEMFIGDGPGMVEDLIIGIGIGIVTVEPDISLAIGVLYVRILRE